ncbi:membrane-associated, eicosanoid/glutathione metabolism protein [Globomyces pollinis-pini]|nr:membrane-associated, eicosanoid/glutathione metabolism protein [Globomyces pollinis-pini]
MSFIPITAVTTSVLSLYYVTLTARVVVKRIGLQVSIGDASKEVFIEYAKDPSKDVKTLYKKYEALRASIRAHGNFGEYVPLTMILFGLAEHSGSLPKIALQIISGGVLFSRILHIEFGLHGKNHVGPGRVAGSASMLACIVALSGSLLIQNINNFF